MNSTRKKEKKIKEEYKVLTDWWKKILGAKIDKIELSKRLVDDPCIVISSEHGYSASMEKIQKAQAFTNQDKSSQGYLYGKKTFEINPNHPAIKELRERVANTETPSSDVEDTAFLMFESALLSSGYSLTDPHEFAARMDRVLKYSLNLDRYEKSSPYEVSIEEEEKKEEKTEEASSSSSSHESSEPSGGNEEL
jgi:heat shock protein beta